MDMTGCCLKAIVHRSDTVTVDFREVIQMTMMNDVRCYMHKWEVPASVTSVELLQCTQAIFWEVAQFRR